MSEIDRIKAPIVREMKSFEEHFRQSMKSSVPLLDKITHYIVKRKGKQVRPMFVFLAAKACGTINDSTYTAASLIELFHTATLVHDDVVDDSNKRRGFFSINSLWKNKIAVLVGDYLLSKGLSMSIDNGELEMLKIFSDAVKQISEGELLQIEKSRKLNFDEKIYFDIIRQKTASLIAACCKTGAISTTTDQTVIDTMYDFGLNTGIAFQIKDDLFDYGSSEKIGKPTGIDIKEKKLTLPIIHVLNKVSRSERRKMVNIIKNKNEDKAKVAELIDIVVREGGIEYARTEMLTYRDRALENLENIPESEARESLRHLLNYTVEREK
ncbi:MAG: octaprenyl-diphosphate synthase [Granulosicoccus sp.]|jgi:octaprenyl-diphosphate synthase